MEPNPSFSHTVPGLWLEKETAGRKREEEKTEKTKVGKETRWWGFSLQGTSRGFVKEHVKSPPPPWNLSHLLPSSGFSALPLMPSTRVQGRRADMRLTQ